MFRHQPHQAVTALKPNVSQSGEILVTGATYDLYCSEIAQVEKLHSVCNGTAQMKLRMVDFFLSYFSVQ